MKAILCVAASCVGISVSASAGDTVIAAPWAGSLIVDAKADVGVLPDTGVGPSQAARPLDVTPSVRVTPTLKVEAVPPRASSVPKSAGVPQGVPHTGASAPEPGASAKPASSLNTTMVPKAAAAKKRVVTTGYASFYRTGYVTANGERFLPTALTAAHRTLPFGTKLLVTNKMTGKSVVVRINDRGPFVRGRSIDLTLGAARAIGLDHAGIASVTMEQQ